ncbi:hypothetical protein SKC41_26415 [Mycobacterium sp. 050128]|uniref:hypothetical protein n=1 Tax=Mycobacterium sp. 050128 TaxID=3096112 RepID=UPI002EDB1633
MAETPSQTSSPRSKRRLLDRLKGTSELIALFGVIFTVGGVVMSLIQVWNHDLDDLRDRKTQCINALIPLSAELAKRAVLLQQVSGSDNPADRQRDKDSIIALTGDWNAEAVACEGDGNDGNSNLIRQNSALSVARNTANSASRREIGDPNSPPDPNDITSAYLWCTSAVAEVQGVQLNGWWIFEDGWLWPPDNFVWGKTN